jgi:hypothetical protein
MLKISTSDTRTHCRLILEGKLITPWVAELWLTCSRARTELDGRQLVIDIKNVTLISQEGENALLPLISEAAKFRSRSVLTKHLLQQLARRSKKERKPAYGCIAPEHGRAEGEKVNLFRINRTTARKVEEYAASGDFCKLFIEDMGSLYLLSFLLSGEDVRAEHCFVAGLENCLKGNSIFKQWARSWTRRMIVVNAIRLIVPVPNDGQATALDVDLECKSELHNTPHRDVVIASVLELADFERFVFVMSVLERHSDQDSSLLLGCLPHQIRDARARALRLIAESLAKNAVTSPRSLTEPLNQKRLWCSRR